MIDKILNTGLAGIKRGVDSAVKHVEEITNAFNDTGSGDYVGAAVGLKLDELQVEASAKVIKVGDELQQSILDILA